MRVTTGLGILTGLAFVGGPAVASTTSQQFQVQLQIQAQCVINTTATLNFGTAGVLGGAGGSTNTDQSATLNVQCTNSTTYDIGLDAGTTTGGVVSQRLLNNGSTSETIKYNLYTNAGRSVIWGNTVSTDTVHATGNGAQQTYTIYGRVPGQNTPTPGTYTDTITVTVTY
jgi:spore coat protein U-like protein